MKMLNSFLRYNPHFIDKLKSFPDELSRNLINKLNNATTEVKFLSLVSEINFGLIFNELGFTLKYEKPLSDGKTPDWEILIDKKKAICEVYRLGQSKKDLALTSFENKLKRRLVDLNFGYHIKYSYREECIDFNQYDLDEIISEINFWLSENRKVGDILTIANNFIFEIRRLNKSNKITYVSHPKFIDFKIHRLVQNEYLQKNNKVTEKLTKYTSEIAKLGVPYFLCIENDFKNAFDFNDFVDYFKGSWCIYSDDYNMAQEIEYSNLGSLIDNPFVSGIIIKLGDEYRKILNPLKKQFIYNRNNSVILEKIKMLKDA